MPQTCRGPMPARSTKAAKRLAAAKTPVILLWAAARSMPARRPCRSPKNSAPRSSPRPPARAPCRQSPALPRLSPGAASRRSTLAQVRCDPVRRHRIVRDRFLGSRTVILDKDLIRIDIDPMHAGPPACRRHRHSRPMPKRRSRPSPQPCPLPIRRRAARQSRSHCAHACAKRIEGRRQTAQDAAPRSSPSSARPCRPKRSSPPT